MTSKTDMGQSDKKTLAIEYEFNFIEKQQAKVAKLLPIDYFCNCQFVSKEGVNTQLSMLRAIAAPNQCSS